jgi:hypothetical protein
MAHGVPTPEATEIEFRKHYLVTGNVAGSAKAVGLPVSTGYELRNRALDDPVFVQARDRIRAKLEPDAEQMAVCAMQLCMERLNTDPDDRMARLMLAAGDGGRVQFQDPGPQYAASFAKIYTAVIGAKKFEAERDGVIQSPGTVTVNVSPTPQAAQRIAEEPTSGSSSEGA